MFHFFRGADFWRISHQWTCQLNFSWLGTGRCDTFSWPRIRTIESLASTQCHMLSGRLLMVVLMHSKKNWFSGTSTTDQGPCGFSVPPLQSIQFPDGFPPISMKRKERTRKQKKRKWSHWTFKVGFTFIGMDAESELPVPLPLNGSGFLLAKLNHRRLCPVFEELGWSPVKRPWPSVTPEPLRADLCCCCHFKTKMKLPLLSSPQDQLQKEGEKRDSEGERAEGGGEVGWVESN